MDCYGLVLAASRDCGLECANMSKVAAYKHTPEDFFFRDYMPAIGIEVPYNRLQPWRGQITPGDVLLFWIEKPDHPRHIAVYTGTSKSNEDTMIHAFARSPRCVVEQRVDKNYWGPRLHSVRKWPHFKD